MSAIQKVSIALPPEMVEQLREVVDRGEYASSSEVIREALRDWQLKRTLQRQGIRDLRRLWAEAMEDETGGRSADTVLNRLERKYQRLANSDR